MALTGDDFLRSWHAAHPGATAQTFADWRGDDGRSAYDRLVDHAAEAGPDATLLELACGDGHLLALIRDDPRGPRDCVGVDLSPEELAAARARLGPDTRLIEAHAAALPLPDASVDVVTCHMAFMLMSEVDAVVAELARVLRPGGRFCAVIGARARHGGYGAFLTELFALLRAEGAPGLGIGDPRARSAAGLAELFGPPDWSAPAIADFDVRFTGEAEVAWRGLSLMYNVDLLSPGGQEALRERTLAAWGPGPVMVGMGMLEVTVQRFTPPR
ncbi:MAG: class I SAM-dependent methyltransferase [Alphaproteobacteria bacterium]|nr:class I SAM-dependent methyltransferase [Alphaproteobacteria bacterium]